MSTVSPISAPYERPVRDRNGRHKKGKTKPKRAWLWVTLLFVMLVLVTAVAIVALLMPKALTAKDSLEQAMPLANQAKNQIIAGDQEAATETVERMHELTLDSFEATDSGLWKSVEWVPLVGANLHAVRIASASTHTIVIGVMQPATVLSLDELKPNGGAFDLEAFGEVHSIIDQAHDTLDVVTTDIATINQGSLIEQVAGGVTKLETAVTDLSEVVGNADAALDVVTLALGSEGPRSYLMMFQNNAESRGTGGNPAAIVRLEAVDGRISIVEDASSGDFENGRTAMITDVNTETVALYGDKIGRYMQDVTLTPDFTETADIMEAFWAESFGTPVDATISFDPVGLSYLLSATGPVTLPTGEDLTSDNAVSLLLNEVYSLYPDPAVQDIFFASAASAVFDSLTEGSLEIQPLLTQINRAIDEGRLMYAPLDDAEEALIASTRIGGALPVNNTKETILGVYVNDITEGKLNYYTDLDVAAQSDQCTADEPSFTTTATFTNTLDPEEALYLAIYISPGRFFPKGVVSTDFVLYGPVGSIFVSATVDGEEVQAKSLPHLGRPAVKINVENPPATSSVVSATFTGGDGDFGPLEVRHTPMVRDTEVTIDTPGCG